MAATGTQVEVQETPVQAVSNEVWKGLKSSTDVNERG